MQAGDAGDEVVEPADAVEVADFVLRKTARPATHRCLGWVGNRSKNRAELSEGGFFDGGVRGMTELLCTRGAEEGTQDARSGGGAVGELLIHEGAGEEIGAGVAGRDEEAEANRDAERVGER